MKATKKLIPALAMLVVSAVVMSTASYAWFTMSREVTAKGMNVTVTAPNNLLIKGEDDGDDFTTIGTSTVGKDIKRIMPSSSINGLKFFAINNGTSVNTTGTAGTDLGQRIEKDTILSDVSSKKVTKTDDGYYVDFKYDVKTEGNDSVDVYVKSFKVERKENTKATDDGLKAIRAAILNDEGNALNDSVTKAVLLPTSPSISTDNYYVDKQAISSLVTDDDIKSTSETKYNDYKLNSGKTADVLNVTNVANVSNKVFTVSSNNIKSITIRVWIEGESKNCNITHAANLNFNVSIVLADVKYTAQ